MFGFGNQPMTGDQLAGLQRRRDMIRNAITGDDFGGGLGGGFASLGAALALRNMDNRINNAFPEAPSSPGGSFPAAPQPPQMGVNRAQYQPGFDGRSMMGENPRWHSVGGAGGGEFPPAPASPQQPQRAPGPNLAQYQPGFDGRSQMGAAPRWHSNDKDGPNLSLGGILGGLFGLGGRSGGGLY